MAEELLTTHSDTLLVASGLKLVALSSADLVGGEKWPRPSQRHPKSHIYTPTLLNSKGQRSTTSLRWFLGRGDTRWEARVQIRRGYDKACELSRIDPPLAEFKSTLHLWLTVGLLRWLFALGFSSSLYLPQSVCLPPTPHFLSSVFLVFLYLFPHVLCNFTLSKMLPSPICLYHTCIWIQIGSICKYVFRSKLLIFSLNLLLKCVFSAFTHDFCIFFLCPFITSDVPGGKRVLIRAFAVVKLLCTEVKVAPHTHRLS